MATTTNQLSWKAFEPLPDDRMHNAGADPELAVEVIAPSESAADIERKVELLLAYGSRIVWVVYPRSQRVRVSEKGAAIFERSMNDSLTLPGILDDGNLPAAPLFGRP